MIVLANARIYSYDSATRRFARHDSLLIEGERIVALDEDPTGVGADRMDLDDATVLPAFADCHVHVTDTGYFLGARDLATVRSYSGFAQAIERLPNDAGFVFAGQYDETTWHDGGVADAIPLERFHSNARALVSRIDGHSCVVNRATLDWLDLGAETQGIERDADGSPTGKLFLQANWRAQAEFFLQIPLAARRAAERRAVDLALSRGTLHLHAQLVGFPRDDYAGEIAALRATQAKIYPKVCEPDPQLAQELGLAYVGGDVFLDGSIGSRTAALARPYSDGDGCGALRFSDDALLAYFSAAEACGIAAGVHAIGDAAIEQCVRVWERVLAGKPSQRGCRHFIEHFEIATPEHIDACARMGIALSMQPQFDLLWGNNGGMYEQRLGSARKRSMNALASIDDTGTLLCGGDDSPVCDLNPLAGMQACVDHHEPSQRLSPHRALAMYTVNAARLAYAENETGNIAAGLAADLAILDRDPLDGARFTDCRVLQTWRNGSPVSP
ncbi:MAG: amidohydrolase family protein [Candidatus Eremiobacteraeota bacterium]|nr:amidohydrolase family protein [Candidatus Eremiobacteraeota bacterium]